MIAVESEPAAKAIALPPIRNRQGIAFTITEPLTKLRCNLLLNANPKLPPEVWSNPQFLAADVVRASDGTFPVRLWRMRDGAVTLWREVRIAANGDGLALVSLDAAMFDAGDVLIVEMTLPLFVAEDANGNTLTPLLSPVDNRNNDPVTFQGRRMEFKQ